MASGDIVMTLYGGKLFAFRAKGSAVEVIDFGLDDYRRGSLQSYDDLVAAFRQQLKKLYKWAKLLPPRVLFCGFFGNACNRMQMKDALIASGARDVILLDFAMAVALGHQQTETVSQKRTYLLWDHDLVQIFAVDDITVVTSYFCEMEMDYLQGRAAERDTVLGIGEISKQSSERMREILADLAAKGFSDHGVYVWGAPSDPHRPNVFGEVELPWLPIDPDWAMRGARYVAGELGSLMKSFIKS